ncbi:haloacid dehalogenase (plasmid) [Fulvitalea axinellae]|uniref:Haloacid dehalogenase n=1 Tax=Fulvitalea axinellae TaxID=1182444 RepID=A0AAU9DDS7_9BACT|nr:haloacid dehalogenase [Fulvitalea axinellae]
MKEYTLAFDVYGTLIDTSGIREAVSELIGSRANEFTEQWRTKQLEYSFRRGLMDDYVPFSVCTSQALDYCCNKFGIDISETDKQGLMVRYKTLPAFPEVAEGLSTLKGLGYRLFAFSNGMPKDVRSLLEHNGLGYFFDGVVSADSVKTFKPNPRIYKHFNNVTDSKSRDTWLVSSNPFDVLGSVKYGMNSIWIQRNERNKMDPWEISYTLTTDGLTKIGRMLSEYRKLN